MPYMIDQDSCSTCSACESACPNEAIAFKGSGFKVNPEKCTECIGFFDEPQCVSVCPVPKTCIVDVSRPRYQLA